MDKGNDSMGLRSPESKTIIFGHSSKSRMLAAHEYQFIRSLRKHKYSMLSSALLVFIVATFVQSKFAHQFMSEVRFIVSEGDVINLNVPDEFNTEVGEASERGMSRMHIFLHSSECTEFMIDTFNLYKHYGIDRGKSYAYERVVKRLTRNIGLNLLGKQSGVMVLSVQDKDRQLAAEMANALVKMLNRMNENYIKDQLKRKVFIYNILYQDVKSEMAIQKEKLSDLIRQYRALVIDLEKRNVDVEELKLSLTNLSQSFEDREQQILRIRQMYMLVSNAIDNENFESITLVNRALPDVRSPYPVALAIGGGITLAYAVLVLVFGWIYYENRELIRALLFGKD